MASGLGPASCMNISQVTEILFRHALVWKFCSTHIHGEQECEAACVCKYVERMQQHFLFTIKNVFFKFEWHSIFTDPINTFSYLSQVVDVAKAIINAVRDPDANGKTYALAGQVFKTCE